jgi:DNA-directed RNA polymerase I subunit RPA2
MLLPSTERNVVQTAGQSRLDATHRPKLRLFCRNPSCVEAAGRGDANDRAVEPIVLPYVYRYLVNELAGMNVRMKLDIR